MLMLSIPCIYECGPVWKVVALCVFAALLRKPFGKSLHLAADDEYRIMVAGEHIECIGVALSLVDR